VLSSGSPELDTVLGGGLDCGTSTIFLGPAGSGKSSMAMKFVYEAARRGEKSAIFAFDENLGIALARSKTLQSDLSNDIESGMVAVYQIDPAEISPGELAYRIKKLVEEQGIQVLVIDSLNGYMNAMPGERFLMLQLHELLAYLGHRGIMTILTLAQHGLIGQMQAPVDLTYLGDTIVLLRFFESKGAVKRALSVIKKRSGAHDDQIREFTTRNSRIEVGKALTQFQGVLTGTPVLQGNQSGEAAAS
jgi:circadian clock protein KaiC